MDPTVIQRMLGQMPQQPQQPTHPAMLPGTLQFETFSRPLDEIEEFNADVNGFLAALPDKAPVIDRQLVVAEGRVTLMVVVKVISD